jgi:hypothetical protein
MVNKFRVRFAGSSQSKIGGSPLRWKSASLEVGLRPNCSIKAMEVLR